MTPQLFLELAVRPALSLLPDPMDTPEARAMLIAIAWQESKLLHRRQLHGGPARSYWQFERGGVQGVVTHRATVGHALAVCDLLDIPAHVESVYEAIEFNDVLACCFARLLLWTLPQRLPDRAQAENGWRQYLAAWRPGKPHPDEWAKNFDRGWELSAIT